MQTCSYCGRSLLKRYWFNPFTGTLQCNRLLCQILSGHLLWRLLSWWRSRRSVR